MLLTATPIKHLLNAIVLLRKDQGDDRPALKPVQRSDTPEILSRQSLSLPSEGLGKEVKLECGYWKLPLSREVVMKSLQGSRIHRTNDDLERIRHKLWITTLRVS